MKAYQPHVHMDATRVVMPVTCCLPLLPLDLRFRLDLGPTSTRALQKDGLCFHSLLR
jgi:hypothetical protein